MSQDAVCECQTTTCWNQSHCGYMTMSLGWSAVITYTRVLPALDLPEIIHLQSQKRTQEVKRLSAVMGDRWEASIIYIYFFLLLHLWCTLGLQSCNFLLT